MNAPSPSPDGSGLPRHGDIRARNQRIAEAARRHHFDPDAAVPFLCECSERRCEELLRMTIRQYQAARDGGDYLVAPGHQVEEAKIVRIKEICWLYRTDAPR